MGISALSQAIERAHDEPTAKFLKRKEEKPQGIP
jgi:hypothetical protein